MGNMGIWQILIVLVIVILLFGTKKLRSMGGDLGSAVKGFKKAVTDDKSEDADFAEKPNIENTSNKDSSENVQSKTHTNIKD